MSVRSTAFGLRIDSAIALPGAADDDDDGLPPDVVIERGGDTPPSKNQPAALRLIDGSLEYVAPRVARYRCAADIIRVSARAEASTADVSALLIATALPCLLWLRGDVVLHSAAVVLPGHTTATAIMAASRTGKSTVLAMLVARGAHVVADDVLCVRMAGSTVTVSGLPGGYFAYHDDPAARAFVAVPATRMIRTARLGAMLVLTRDDRDAPPSFTRMERRATLAAILSHRHRPAAAALVGRPGEQLSRTIDISTTLAYAWRRRAGSVALSDDEYRALASLNRQGDDDRD